MKAIELETSNYREALKNRFQFELDMLRQEGLKVQFDEYCREEKTTFVFKLKPEEEELWALVKEYIANAVSDIIINQVEEKEMTRFLRTNYREFSPEEREKILQFAYERLNSMNRLTSSDLTATLRRKNQVANKVLNYLTEETRINLEGFAEFRLKNYLADLKLAVEEAVDEYLIEQEYQKFIDLLEDMIDEDGDQHQIVNVIRTENNNFQLLDESGVQIKSDRLDEYLKEGTQMIATEDKLISALISLGSQEVILHFKNPKSVVEILKNIFEDRVSMCMGCKYCKNNKYQQ